MPYQKSFFFSFLLLKWFSLRDIDMRHGYRTLVLLHSFHYAHQLCVRALNIKWNYSVLSLWKLCAYETRRQFPQNRQVRKCMFYYQLAEVSEAHNGILDLLHQCTLLQGRACSRKKSNSNDLETVIKQKSRKSERTVRTNGKNVQSSKRSWTSSDYIFQITISKYNFTNSSCRQRRSAGDLNFEILYNESNRQTSTNTKTQLQLANIVLYVHCFFFFLSVIRSWHWLRNISHIQCKERENDNKESA